MGDKGEGAVKKSQKMGDVIYGWPQLLLFREHFLKIELFSDYSQLSTSTIEFLNHKVWSLLTVIICIIVI